MSKTFWLQKFWGIGKMHEPCFLWFWARKLICTFRFQCCPSREQTTVFPLPSTLHSPLHKGGTNVYLWIAPYPTSMVHSCKQQHLVQDNGRLDSPGVSWSWRNAPLLHKEMLIKSRALLEESWQRNAVFEEVNDPPTLQVNRPKKCSDVSAKVLPHISAIVE